MAHYARACTDIEYQFPFGWSELEARIPELLAEIQQSLFDKALAFRKANTHEVETYEEFKAAVDDGFALAWWCGSGDCDNAIKSETKATNRCIPMDQPGGEGKCIHCGKAAKEKAIFGKAY